MRRPRHKLQVSTFPFLAVLLAAMGALILLLLVMDRRSKVVAQNKAREVHRAQVAERARLAASDDAEVRAVWERQRQELHDMLAREQNELQSQFAALRLDLDHTTANARQEEANQLALRSEIHTTQEQIDAAKRQAETLHQEKSADAAKKRTQAEKRLQAMTADLLKLESTLAELKSLKNRPTDVFSLVPYRGAHGEGRRPIYVECTRNCIVFLPERKLLIGDSFTVANIRAEVQARGAKLVKEETREALAPPRRPEEKSGPYVLFLVRPDGIEAFYQAQSAFIGLQADFGYEFIDQNWVLDIPDAQVVSVPSVAPRAFKSDDGLPRIFGDASGAAKSASSAPSVSMSTGSSPAPPELRNGTLGPSSGSSQIPSKNPSDVPLATAVPEAKGRTDGTKSLTNAPRTPLPPPTSTGGGGAYPAGAKGIPSVSGILTSTGTSITPGGSLKGSTASSLGLGIAQGANATPPGGVQAQSQSGDKLDWRPGAKGLPGTSKDRTASVNVKGSESAPKGAGATSGLGFQGEAGEQPPADPLAKFAPPPLGKSDPAPKSTLGKRTGNRDVIITISCMANEAMVSPGETWFAMQSAETNANLAQTVRRMIERRQASVPEGEAAYRFVIRFVVYSEGLRTYYRVYPLLEDLHVQMIRENVE